ncbi:glycoside hydrolase domain-containing protein [Bacillus sp. 2205SS5-2]|uniref:glycoside hydrolase domain-containing protein n=1 Tax=Bacillus sp. 2205SS5-2 TaxID=3109031 RepID=UPI0030078B36
MAYLWGVDSPTKVTTDLYNCVVKSLGKPSYWGRYLTTVEGASDGLTRSEIDLLHNSGTKILPIYNNFSNATGLREGRVVAQNATFAAQRLGIPKGTLLFAYMEKSFKVDEDWIRGYVDRIYSSGYLAGMYHDPVNGDFLKAYCAAIDKDEDVALQLILWSAEPERGVSIKRRVPKFRPAKLPCQNNTWGWQYGRDAEACPVDTNLFDERLFSKLY